MYILTFRDASIDPHFKTVPSWLVPHYIWRDVKIYVCVCVCVYIYIYHTHTHTHILCTAVILTRSLTTS